MAKAIRISNAGGRSLVVIDEGAGRLKMEAEQRQTVDIPVVMVSKLKGKDAWTQIKGTASAVDGMRATQAQSGYSFVSLGKGWGVDASTRFC